MPDDTPNAVLRRNGTSGPLAEPVDASGDRTVAARARLRPAVAQSPATEETPAMVRGEEWIGAYRLVKLLGEGGMGSVFLAEQRQPVRRTVALKLMRSSLKGPIAAARFSAERQALARLSHSNIAAMYEAGTTDDGYPYFAMEWVDGSPLTTWCDSRKLSIRERLELFRQICDGVQHAHQKGLIHRDLKPSNVLVTEVEGRPVPKIIDFGIAKTLDQPLGDESLLTGDGIIGTPAYMSPEALNGSREDLDTRTDVYSLGVLLYELIAGVRPRETEGVPLAALIRDATEQETAAPRVRFRALDTAARTEIARSRSLDPEALERAFRGDVNWIIARATARDREARYRSAAELGSDIEHHLQDEPVLASPPSLRYRTAKFARRHRGAVFAAALVLTAVIGGVVATTTAMFRAQRARSEAEAVSGFLSDLISAASPWNRTGETTVRELLDQAAVRVPRELNEYPAARAKLLLDIGTAQFHLGHSDRAEPLLREALRIRREVDGPDSPLLAQVQNILALVRSELGDFKEAERLLRASLVIREKKYGHEHGSVAGGLFDLSGIMQETGRYAEAERLCRESLAIRQRLHARNDPETPLENVAMTMAGLGQDVSALGRLGEAETLFRNALALWEQAGQTGYAYARTERSLAANLALQRRYPEAEAYYRKGLTRLEPFVEPNDLRMATTMTSLASVLRAEGKFAEAETILRRALEMERKSRDVPRAVQEETQITKSEYASLLRQLGRDSEAIP